MITISTDSAPAMIRKNNGCVALLQNFLGRAIFSYHCIIHQEALCTKDMKLDDIMVPVVRCINYIRAKALHRRHRKESFPVITNLALQFLCSFRSTYVYEKVFSDLNYIKNKCRISLSEQHISDLVLLTTANLNPDIRKLVQLKHCQKSH
ncbi:unnamed protein product [Diatraea saccharalis]|uniref:Transposase n=1 Tax=Diatraea saccharalis TaxID=40085 RepID=A0A9N9WGF3_9NEOP|nr:unnamed protein product [Diatraea saccharalis]